MARSSKTLVTIDIHDLEKMLRKIVRTERLAHAPQGLNLKGCRTTRVGQNFRIIFVICEGCKIEPDCAIVIARDWQTRRLFFLNVGPHDKAYAMK